MNNNRGQIRLRLRFLADENISPKTVSYLNALGYNVIRVNEVKMVKVKDKEIIEYARVNGYVLITMDLDFGYILSYIKDNKPSVIILRLTYPDPDNVSSHIIKALKNKEIIDSLIEGSVIIIIEDDRIRVRRLPL
jgi:predicted nuclease of predicted toxin-antitoxin system